MKRYLGLFAMFIFSVLAVACQPEVVEREVVVTVEVEKEVTVVETVEVETVVEVEKEVEVEVTRVVEVAEVAPEAEEVSIAIFHPVLGNTYTKALTDGAEEVATQLGGTIDVFGADPAFDAVAQSNQIQDAITSGKYDAF
ncbi:MAG: hypothetical protein AAF485_06785, partial [Chloroflexota bacterium]